MHESGAEISGRESDKERIKPFLAEYKSLGHHGQSIKNLTFRIPHFISFLEEAGIYESEITLQTAYDYQGYLIERGRQDGKPYKASTIRSYIKAAALYSSWLEDTGQILSNPFNVMRKVPEGQSLPKDLPKEEALGHFLRGLSNFNSEFSFKKRLRRYRTHVMAETLYASGLRLSELGDIRLEDVDLISGRIFVLYGKGGKSRYVFLTEYAVKILDIYIHRVRPLIIRYYPSVDQTRLFLSSPETLGHTLNGDLKEAAEGDIVCISAHRLRHCLGYHLIRCGCPLRYIQQILGHSHIKTSEVYTKVDGEKLGEMLISCHPRSRHLPGHRFSA